MFLQVIANYYCVYSDQNGSSIVLSIKRPSNKLMSYLFLAMLVVGLLENFGDM